MGKSKINKRIYKNTFWKNEKTLKPEDILGALNTLIKVNYGFDSYK